MKQLLLLTTVTILMLAGKCEETPKDKGYQLGQPFTLRVQELMECDCDAPEIKFEGVKEDSRCPKHTNCVWAGQAIVQLSLAGSAGIEPLELTLQEGKPELASKTAGGYIYRLEEVNPYPEAGKKIAPKDYTVRLVVEKP